MGRVKVIRVARGVEGVDLGALREKREQAYRLRGSRAGVESARQKARETRKRRNTW